MSETSASRRFVWPRWVRVALMAWLFAIFFFGSPLLALFVLPLVALVSGPRAKDRATHLLHLGMKGIMRTAKLFGIVDLELPAPPSEVDLSKPYVLVSNHPSFIDMLVILGTFSPLTCVTNGRWWKHWALGRLLRATNYVAGPGAGAESDETDTLTKMVAQLERGLPLLVFPEGQRSLPDRLRRFRRGAVEAAVRAKVPILPLYLVVDPPYLTKTIPLWRPPARLPTYRFEWMAPILPSEGADARALHESLEEAYEARFEARRAPQAGSREPLQARV
ncbi:MAG: 1-acyl-sn-glycerol-3-phosphate acyltransferase [Sandaracinaceae bacterium]|nr:1-acyl-sn-glycerol-3-phosphate acyltransferase [Sandaracinaceae bacterium]